MTEHDHDHEHGEDCDHDDDEIDDDYEPSSPEVIAERRARLTDTLNALTLDDLNRHMQSAPEQVRAALTSRLSVRLDPKFIKGGVGRLIRTRLRGLSPTKQVEMAAELTAGLDQESSDFLGEESFAMPSREELDRLVDHLLASHPAVIVRTYLACTSAADAPVAEELDKILAADARLALVEA